VKPLAQYLASDAKALVGIAFDLDDTVLTHGLLTAEALAAMHALSATGLPLVGVTGRPAAFGEFVTRQWGLNGCVAENGAIYIHSDAGRVLQQDTVSLTLRAQYRKQLRELEHAMKLLAPKVNLTDDMPGRVSDSTWDIGEFALVEDATVRHMDAAMRKAGARTTRSSVHLHATFDAADKASGLADFCQHHLGIDASIIQAKMAFIGDSGNDAPCFAGLQSTFGVANVCKHRAQLTVLPKYVTKAEMGAGFAEFAHHILAARAQP
jgi:HAD superfamily hydrolase (TIGR01484 family)